MLKRLAALLLVGMLFVGGAVANDDPEEVIEELEAAANTFASEFATTLAHYNSLGLGWSDAYIGQLFSFPPSLGLGVTAGVVTIPLDPITEPLAELNIDVDEALADLPGGAVLGRLGLPLPGATVDARVGGIGMPFDVGFKIGTIPGQVDLGDDVDIDYLLVGGDFRYALLEGGGFLPKLSVGLGVNHSRFNLGIAFDDIELGEGEFNDQEYAIMLLDPTFDTGWRSTAVELKGQASMGLLIFQPFVGAGVAYTTSSVQGAFSGELGVGEGTFEDLPPGVEEEDVRDLLEEQLGDLSEPSVAFDGAHSGFSARVFGGLGLRILVLNLDVGASIDTQGSIGLELNTRIQF